MFKNTIKQLKIRKQFFQTSPNNVLLKKIPQKIVIFCKMHNFCKKLRFFAECPNFAKNCNFLRNAQFFAKMPRAKRKFANHKKNLNHKNNYAKIILQSFAKFCEIFFEKFYKIILQKKILQNFAKKIWKKNFAEKNCKILRKKF